MARKIDLKSAMTFKRFIQRSEVLKLYRDMLRCVRQVDNKTQREELTTFIRHDFKANKHHTDEEAIKMLITRGRKSLKDLQMTLRLSR